MALPTTITGINTSPACIGPFISSGGNVYLIGYTGSKPQAQKATDPTTSFSAVGTDPTPGGTGLIVTLAAYQVGDTIHVAGGRGGTGATYFYLTFDMSSDAWVLNETIITGINPFTSTSADPTAISLVVRSGGEVDAFFNGARVANMGNSYAQTYYSRRTGVNTWSAATQVSAGGQVDYISPEAVLGVSDRVQFAFNDIIGHVYNRRALTSANVLQTVQTSAVTIVSGFSGISYDNGGTQKDIVGYDVSSNVVADKFNDGDTPAISGTTVQATDTMPVRIFNDGTTAYCIYRGSADSDLYVETSNDNGATWTGRTSIFTGTVAGADANLSIDGNIFTRGSSVVIPYVVNDNGTLKYNEYVVRTIVSDILFAQSVM